LYIARFHPQGRGGFNQPKTLSGIETTHLLGFRSLKLQGFNQPKTLSGIETEDFEMTSDWGEASTNPKPFQGLKQQLPLQVR